MVTAGAADGQVRFRLARLEDAPIVAAYHVLAWQAGYEGLLPAEALAALSVDERTAEMESVIGSDRARERGVTMIVATIDDQPVGHCTAQMIPPSIEPGNRNGHILHLYVHPDQWGRGLGRSLLAMGERQLYRQGARTAELWVLHGNDRAIGLYERSGWSMSGDRKTDEMNGMTVEEVQMTRNLSRDVVLLNRADWDAAAPFYDEHTSKGWERTEPNWGIFGVPDCDRNGEPMFPDVIDKDVVELGCGTGYVSWWAIANGARRAIGLDNSNNQLRTAQRNAEAKHAELPLIQGDAHRLPFADDSFDVAINEYGAAIWCDPRIWIPEAARVLRPGGTLWFLGNSIVSMLCVPEFEGELATPTMLRPQRDIHRWDWIDTDSIEFHVSHGEMIQILTGAGFIVTALHELYAEPGQTSPWPIADGDWAARWPIEEIWVAQLH